LFEKHFEKQICFGLHEIYIAQGFKITKFQDITCFK